MVPNAYTSRLAKAGRHQKKITPFAYHQAVIHLLKALYKSVSRLHGTHWKLIKNVSIYTHTFFNLFISCCLCCFPVADWTLATLAKQFNSLWRWQQSLHHWIFALFLLLLLHLHPKVWFLMSLINPIARSVLPSRRRAKAKSSRWLSNKLVLTLVLVIVYEVMNHRRWQPSRLLERALQIGSLPHRLTTG